MRPSTIKDDALLLLTAAIWGFAFVAQRAGMEYIQPFAFNGIRFALGSISLLPIILVMRRRRLVSGTGARVTKPPGRVWLYGVIAGVALFAGYDVAPDAERFLMVRVKNPENDKRGFAVVQNWFAEFEDHQ